MKLKHIVLVAVFLTVLTNIECRYTNRTQRSVKIYDIISNKTLQVSNYVIFKGRSLKNFTVNTASHTVSYISTLISSGKERISKFIDQKRSKISRKFQNYIDMAEKTATTIYDNIAPEQVDYECKDDDSATQKTTPELITIHGYTAESHNVVTDDGYILTLHRIPFPRNHNKSPQRAVLLHHGLLASSADWILPGPRKGLAYILSDAGYDVWMANARGNTYSRAHIHRDVNSYAFWNFSFHEVAQYDLPATIDYIVSNKGGDVKINYVGFSMGTTVLFSLLSSQPHYNNVLRAGFALAPVVYMTDIKSPFKLLSKFGNNIEHFMKLLGANEFLPRNALVRYISKHSCAFGDFEETFCEMSMFLLCSHDKEHFDRSLTPLIFGHVPAGASTKTLAHYAQEIRNKGKFQLFDYGAEDNMKLYGMKTPPEYPVEKITLPIVLMSAKDDWLSSMADANKLYNILPNPVEHYIIKDKTFNHVDFMFARDARELVYDPLVTFMERSYLKPVTGNEISDNIK